MTKQRAMGIIQDLINDDLECMDLGDVQDKLFQFMDEMEIRELGFGWILDGDEDGEEE